MFNAMKLPSVTKLVQVGVRDVSPGEISFIENSGGRISLFDDYSCSRRLYAGEKWNEICLDIVSRLPEKVYVSFDMTGWTRRCVQVPELRFPEGSVFNRPLTCS